MSDTMGNVVISPNLILILLLGAVLAVIFYYPSKLLKIPDYLVILALVLFSFGIILKIVGVVFIASFVFILLILWAFLIAMYIDRRYVYFLTITLFVITLLLFFSGLLRYSEYSAVLVFFSLILGIVKDIFFKGPDYEV